MKSLLLSVFAIFLLNLTALQFPNVARGEDDSLSPYERLVAAATADRPGLLEKMQRKELARAQQVDPAQENTKEIYVVLEDGVDPRAFAKENGMELVRSSPALTGRNSHVFKVGNQENALLQSLSLSSKGPVKESFLNETAPFVELSNVPNDPYFVSNGFDGQWAANHRFRSQGTDTEVLGAWSQGYWGQGVIVGIVDDGTQIGHPDLAPNADSNSLHFDYVDNDGDANPAGVDDNHGTAVAGIAAARANNGIGVAGIAGRSKFVALRALGGSLQGFVDAILHANSSIDVKNHSWGLRASTDPFLFTPELRATRDAFIAVGNSTIHVKSAGNARFASPLEDCAKDVTSQGPRSVVVGALDKDGEFASYSSFGAPMMCCAVGGSRSVTTTDRTGTAGYNLGGTCLLYREPGGANVYGIDYNPNYGLPSPFDYTRCFDGTSAAAPFVSGIIALAKEANPLINRDNIGHLIVRSCDIVDPYDTTNSSDGGWRTNAAGNSFNQNYGFGKLNAAKLVTAAQRFTGTAGEGLVVSNGFQSRTIPDSGSSSQFVSLAAPGLEGKVTELLVAMEVGHGRRGDVSCYVRSPSGFRSRLFQADARDTGPAIGGGSNLPYLFRSMAFWGEDYEGVWEIEFIDNRAGFDGIVYSGAIGTYLETPVFRRSLNNDDFENAWDVDSLEPVVATNSFATTEPYESDITEFNTRRTRWWKGVATTTGFVNVDTFGSNFDTVLHVYRSHSDSIEDLELLDRNDDFGGTRQSFVRVPVVSGDQIAIRVSGFNGAAGNIRLEACGIGPKIIESGNDLIVRGSNDDDDIFVSEAAGFTHVEINGSLRSYPGLYDVTVIGFDGDDTILSDIPGVVINGMNGNDTITYFGSGSSDLIGGNDADTIRGGSGPDVIFGGAGDDLIISRAGNDTIYGGLGDDEIRGISGRNFISGGGGNNQLYGGAGPDEIVGGVDNDVIFGGSGVDEIQGGAGFNTIEGGLASDIIFGGSDRDIINGGPGNDTINGFAGDDVLTGDSGSDEIVGGPGNDRIIGGPGLDRLYGLAGNDVLQGNASTDLLVGGIGNDQLDGGPGPDNLVGGGGNDTLTGGEGHDLLNGGQGTDTATDEGEAGEISIEN